MQSLLQCGDSKFKSASLQICVNQSVCNVSLCLSIQWIGLYLLEGFSVCLSDCLSVCQWINDSNETEKVTGPNSSCVLSLNFYIPRREDDVFFRFYLVSLFIYLFIYIYIFFIFYLSYLRHFTHICYVIKAGSHVNSNSGLKKKRKTVMQTQNCNFRMLNQLAQRMFSSWLILQTFTKHSNHHAGRQTMFSLSARAVNFHSSDM